MSRLVPRAPAAIDVSPPLPHNEERQAADLRDLVAAYPDYLVSVDGQFLHWRDGGRTPLRRSAASRTADRIVDDPDIVDVFAWDYPLGNTLPGSGAMGDPGRARPAALFTRMYGDCRKGEVQKQLVEVAWAGGKRLRFTPVNGAAAALGRVAADLDHLGPAYGKYLWPTSGTFNCRVIAGTQSPSMHSYGAAIDLASRYGAYWRWGANRGQVLPYAVIAAFERHGFIWGGKWAHFDTFHFEYRPELIAAARRKGGEALKTAENP